MWSELNKPEKLQAAVCRIDFSGFFNQEQSSTNLA